MDLQPTIDLDRWLRGLRCADLLTDLMLGGPYTLIAPIDRAFDALRWSFDELTSEDGLVEPCIDIFEYSVIRGAVDAHQSLRRASTLHGESVLIGDGLVVGPGNTGRIVATLRAHGFTVHATDACVLPTSVLDALEAEVEAARVAC